MQLKHDEGILCLSEAYNIMTNLEFHFDMFKLVIRHLVVRPTTKSMSLEVPIRNNIQLESRIRHIHNHKFYCFRLT